MGKILVVLEDRSQAHPLIAKAIMLAKAYDAELCLYKHSYDAVDELNRYIGFDNFEEMKDQIIEDDEQWLSESIAEIDFQGVDISCRTQWGRRLYQGVLEAAEEFDCELIIKAANVHNRLQEIVHTPDDWSIMRGANCPVMLVRLQKQAKPEGAIVVAINPLEDEKAHHDLHVRVLIQAQRLAKALQAKLVVVTGIPMLNYNVPYFVGVGAQYPELQSSLRENAKISLVTMLEEHSIDVDEIIIDDGHPEHVIHQVCDQYNAQMVVIGTVANKGISGIFLGNTAERILHHINNDVFVVT